MTAYQRISVRYCQCGKSQKRFAALLILTLLCCVYYAVFQNNVAFTSQEFVQDSSSSNASSPQSASAHRKHHKEPAKLRTLAFKTSAIQVIKNKIWHEFDVLPPKYTKVNPRHKLVIADVMRDLTPTDRLEPLTAWHVADKLATEREIVPEKAKMLGSVLQAMETATIVSVDSPAQLTKGTQLKLILTLDGGQQAIFKPTRDAVVLNKGLDRPNSEVAAFHLGLLLGIRRIPLCVGRRISLVNEVIPVAPPDMLREFYRKGNRTCFTGKHRSSKGACEVKGLLEGALILWLPTRFAPVSMNYPWHEVKTTRGLTAKSNFCELVQSNAYFPLKITKQSTLLDVIETGILDFIIENIDRHEMMFLSMDHDSSAILVDNGKGFGHPSLDRIELLAPLYQCCMLRRSTWDRLVSFTGGKLSHALNVTTKGSAMDPVLSPLQFAALDRRLRVVIATVMMCANHSDISTVLV